MVCFVGILAIDAATTEKKPTTTTNNNVKKNKDIKEKRDAAQTHSVPYSYETPQKSFQVPAQSQYQQKVAAIEYQQPRQEQHQQTQQVQHVQHVQHIQPQQYQKVQPQIQQQYHHIQESAPQQHSFSSYPSAGLESFYGQPMKSSGFGDFGYEFPGFENFEHVQGLNYNQNVQNINSAYAGGQYGIPSKSPIYSIKQQVEFPSFNYADLHSAGLAQSAPSYSFPMQAYAIPQQQLHESIPAYFNSYAPQAQSYAPHAQSYAPQASHSYAPIELGYGFNQAALYTPQALAISASKPTKTPDYAHGVKGLGHFSTASALSAAPTTSYSKPSYQPQYQYIQQATEKPFRASAFLGASQSHDSLTEQSIASIKPANDYLPPSKQYLPAKEQHNQLAQHQQLAQQHYQQPQKQQQQQHQFIHHIPASEHVQVQYIQQQPSKTYITPSQNSFSSKPFAQAPKNNYLPPQNNYLPPKSSYLPAKPSNSYLPANHQFTSNSNSHPSLSSHHHQQQQQQYAQPQQYTQSHEDSYELDYQSSAPAHQQQSVGHK